jgi:hypothetical protein
MIVCNVLSPINNSNVFAVNIPPVSPGLIRERWGHIRAALPPTYGHVETS